jgi:formate dehydrogenase major subunit
MKVRVTDAVRPGVLYTTFHFPEAAINFLTSGIGDQYTLTPEYKVTAVDFEKSLYGIFTRAECLSIVKTKQDA